MEPVVYCVVACMALLESLPHDALLRGPQASVVVVDDAVLRTLGARPAPPAVLYFSKDDYRRAMATLSPPDVASVIEKRRTAWSPQALDHGVRWLFQQQRDALWRAAALQPRLRGEAATRLAAHVQTSLELLARISGDGRYDDLSLAELLVATLERVAQADAEAASFAATSRTPALDPRIGQELGRMLAGLGRPEYAQAPVHATTRRGVYVSPADAALRAGLRASGDPFLAWRDGVLADVVTTDLAKFRRQGLDVHVLYLDGGELLEDAADLTPAQLDREARTRARTMADDPEAAARAHVRKLRLEATLALAAARARVAGERPALAPAMDRLLAAALAAVAADVPPQDGAVSTDAALAALAQAERALARDLGFLVDWAGREKRADLAERWRGWLAFKQAQVAALEGRRTP
jgi:hypothetical protein